jgi:MYXO-CTERM domain-containing protein
MRQKRIARVLAAAIAACLGTAVHADITGFDTNTQAQGTNFTPTVTGTGVGSVLTLTDNNGSEGTSAFNVTPQNISNFIATFTYQSGGNKAADGAAFVIQNDPRGATALGDTGGSLGYGGGAAIKPSVAMQINLYAPNTPGAFVNVNGGTGSYNGGPVNTASGLPIATTVTYNGAKIVYSMNDGTNTYTGTKFISVPGVVGANTGIVGFTGGTGGLTASQTVTNFQYTAGTVAAPAFTSAWTVKRTNLDTVNNTANAGGGTAANTIENTDEADALAHGTGGFVSSGSTTETVGGINYNNDFPGGRGDNFAATATGFVHLPGGVPISTYLYVDSDDGFRLRINGSVISEYVAPTGGSNTITGAPITLHEGDAIELLMAEDGGGEKLIFQTDADGNLATTGDRQFVGDAPSGIQITSSVPEPGTFALLGVAVLPLLRRRRR